MARTVRSTASLALQRELLVATATLQRAQLAAALDVRARRAKACWSLARWGWRLLVAGVTRRSSRPRRD